MNKKVLSLLLLIIFITSFSIGGFAYEDRWIIGIDPILIDDPLTNVIMNKADSFVKLDITAGEFTLDDCAYDFLEEDEIEDVKKAITLANY